MLDPMLSWHSLGERSRPDTDDWLTAGEAERAAAMRFTKRRDEWLLAPVDRETGARQPARPGARPHLARLGSRSARSSAATRRERPRSSSTASAMRSASPSPIAPDGRCAPSVPSTSSAVISSSSNPAQSASSATSSPLVSRPRRRPLGRRLRRRRRQPRLVGQGERAEGVAHRPPARHPIGRGRLPGRAIRRRLAAPARCAPRRAATSQAGGASTASSCSPSSPVSPSAAAAAGRSTGPRYSHSHRTRGSPRPSSTTTTLEDDACLGQGHLVHDGSPHAGQGVAMLPAPGTTIAVMGRPLFGGVGCWSGCGHRSARGRCRRRLGGAGPPVHAGRGERAVHQQQQPVGQRRRVRGAGGGGQDAQPVPDGLLVGEGGGVPGMVGLGELGRGHLEGAAQTRPAGGQLRRPPRTGRPAAPRAAAAGSSGASNHAQKLLLASSR